MTASENQFISDMKNIKLELVPYETNLEKIRIGVAGDGGYVINNIEKSDGLFSYGCDDNIKFEKAYHEKYGATCWVYDHTIDGITNCPDYITFFKQGVGPKKTDVLDTFDNQIGDRDCSNMFAQIDIEGYEWITLKDSVKIKEFAQLIIEFHISMQMPCPIMIDTLKFLNKYFVCTHIHGNNCPLQPWIDINLPRVFECTYVRNDLITWKKVDIRPYPLDIDFPNSSNFPDLPLTWWHPPSCATRPSAI